jgi:ribosomal protein L19
VHRIVKNVPVLSGEWQPRSPPGPIKDDPENILNCNLITRLRREQRLKINKADDRWRLFDRNSPNKVTVGSILRVTFKNSNLTLLGGGGVKAKGNDSNAAAADASQPFTTNVTTTSSFTGILIALRRHVSEPTIVLRTIIDGVGVEQIFPVFSPNLTSIEVVRPAVQKKGHKLYWLREKPSHANEFVNLRRKKSNSESLIRGRE